MNGLQEKLINMDLDVINVSKHMTHEDGAIIYFRLDGVIGGLSSLLKGNLSDISFALAVAMINDPEFKEAVKTALKHCDKLNIKTKRIAKIDLHK